MRKCVDAFLRGHGRRQGAHGIHLGPDALHQKLRLLAIGEGMLERKESAIIAMSVYPATDDVDLVDLGLADDIGRRSQLRRELQQRVQRVVHRTSLVRGTGLMHQPSMPDEEDLVMLLYR